MKGPTICRLPCGSARRTSNPSPRSRVRGTMTSSSASQDLGSPSTGSLEGSQLMRFLRHNNGRLSCDEAAVTSVIPNPKLLRQQFVQMLGAHLPTKPASPILFSKKGAAMTLRTRPGITINGSNDPIVETERLILRRWSGADVAPNTAMLSDPASARFITADGKPVTDQFVGWRNAAIMAGHWVLHGVGMFVVEEKTSGSFAGRVGPWFPPAWPGGFEVGWGIAAAFRGKG